MLRIVRTACLLGAVALAAAPGKDSGFPETIDVEGETWRKSGSYRYVYRFFFPLYDAALYAPENAARSDVLNAKTGFRLQFRYLRKIEKSIILKSADKMLSKNLSGEEKVAISDEVDRLNRAYRTVRDGDESSLTFLPGRGTTLRINGKPEVAVGDQAFAAFYFQIWLGEKPISSDLKEAVLAGLDD